jgi:two-component system, cell cycle sensor histidine kinase and response regulator CckA
VDPREPPRAELSTALLDLGYRLAGVTTPEEAARTIAAAAQDVLGWDAYSLDLYSAESGTVRAVVSMDRVGGREPVDVPHAYATGLAGAMTRKVATEGAQLILRDVATPGADGLTPFGEVSRPSASLMFVPVRHGERVAGILSIQSYTPRAYDEADLAVLQTLADHCGSALERLRIEAALRESREQLQRAESVALVMTAHVGLDGRWLKVPPRLGELLGYSEAELRSRTVPEVMHPDDLAPIASELRKLVSGEVRSSDHTARLIRRDGGTVWVLANASTVQDDAGAPLYFLVYLRDVTERKNLEEQLRQAQKMEAVGRLAGGVAHDFNNLLTAIIGNADLLLRVIEPEDARRLDVLEINRAAHRAATLVRQLLAFSRKQVLKPRLVDLNTVVTDLSAMLRRVIGEHVALRVELQPQLGRVLADPGQLEQVITNLAVNARDAMPSGGTLLIRTADVDPADVPGQSPESVPLVDPLVELSVRDDGVGMDERTLARLFEPFFTTKELGRGTGLGLATVYGIVRQSGGHIRVNSRLHHGSTFAVYLPRVEGRGERVEEPPEWTDQPRAAGTVLVVEDDLSVRRLACRVLRARGYRVLEAGDGDEALELVHGREGALDLVITDIIMPGLSGPALVERLLPEASDLRVLYITGYSEEAIRQQGVLPAGGALLEKPFTAHQLAERVRGVLAKTET